MKKFSNITGVKVSEEKKPKEIKLNEEDLFKSKVLNLLEQLLTVRTYGPVDRYLRAGNIKIAGQELFLEALMDLLNEKSLKQETKILESLKSSIKDWEVIDTKIEEANNKIQDIKSKENIKSNLNKINSLINSYGQDEELLLNMVDESCNKIKNGKTAYYNHLATLQLIKENKFNTTTLKKISQKFEIKAQQLGYSEE